MPDIDGPIEKIREQRSGTDERAEIFQRAQREFAIHGNADSITIRPRLF